MCCAARCRCRCLSFLLSLSFVWFGRRLARNKHNAKRCLTHVRKSRDKSAATRCQKIICRCEIPLAYENHIQNKEPTREIIKRTLNKTSTKNVAPLKCWKSFHTQTLLTCWKSPHTQTLLHVWKLLNWQRVAVGRAAVFDLICGCGCVSVLRLLLRFLAAIVFRAVALDRLNPEKPKHFALKTNRYIV